MSPTTTLRSRFTYLHLSLLTDNTSIQSRIGRPPPIDILTARTLLTSSLEQYLGVTGTAIPIDFLKIEGSDIWVRLPSEDKTMVVGALSQWIGKDGGVSWRVLRQADWLDCLVAGDGRDLFNP